MLIRLTLVVFALVALAFVNPNFTPLHVVADAEHIGHFQAQVDADDSNMLQLRSGQQIKGSVESELRIDISSIDQELREEELDPVFADQGSVDALLFIAAEGSGSSLHIGRYWATLQQDEVGAWRVSEWNDGRLLGAWDGGTDQLLRVVRYVLDNPDPQVPAASGAEWMGSSTVGQMEGQVSSMQIIQLGDDSAKQLFIASDAGDQLLAWDNEAQSFSAAEPALPSASTLSQWGAFAGEASLSLVSYQESLQHVWYDKGEWQQEAMSIDGITAISGLAVAPGKTGQQLVIAGAHGLALASRGDDGWSASLLPVTNLGDDFQAGPVLVGDFNASGLLDLILLHGQGALLFQGTEPGAWQEGQPIEAAPALGSIRSAVAVDVDNDGLLDIIAIGDAGLSLWHNRGAGRFAERRDDSGEIRYIPNALVRDVIISDFNNDGRPDITLLNPGMGPHIFYNRGFMVFGFAEDLVGGTLPQEIYQGQQRGLMADITGDGAEELFTVLEDGSILRLQRDVDSYMTMGAQLRLAGEVAARGPVMISAGDEDREMYGTRVLAPGSSVLIGRSEPGPLFVRWRFCGEDWQEDMVIVEDGALPISITSEGLQQ